MKNYPLPRIDKDDELKKMLLPYCRLKEGEIWIDKKNKHKIGCINSNDKEALKTLFKRTKADLALHDPPYNMVAFQETDAQKFVEWSKEWIENSKKYLKENLFII